MRSKLLIVVLFLAAVGGVLWFAQQQRSGPRPAGSATGAVTSASQGKATDVVVTFVYGTEKREWVEAAAQSFRSEHPNVELQLVGMGSLESANALLEGKIQPTVWSPADQLVLNLAASDWETKSGSALFGTGEDAASALVITPLVFVAWEDRAEVLAKAGGGTLGWKVLDDAVTSPKGWPAVGGKSEWGFVKLGHTDPTRSNSGLQALVSMTYDYFHKTSGLTVADVLDPKYQAWVRELERGTTHTEHSSGTFMTDMIRFGPSKYDVAVVYENLAASQLENAQGRWGNLQVYYPSVTLWSDHPAGVLAAPWVTESQRKAARLWLKHLRSRPVQEQALRFGFRPGDPSVPVKSQDPSNPFNKLAAYGLKVDIPSAAQPPEPAVVRNLLSMWSRVVQKGQ